MVSVSPSRMFLWVGGGSGVQRRTIRLNHANEFPGVRFTKREDCFSFFFSSSFHVFMSLEPISETDKKMNLSSLFFLPMVFLKNIEVPFDMLI